MKKQIIFIVMLAMISILTTSCISKRKQIAASGVMGSHELLRIEQPDGLGVNGKIIGNFFCGVRGELSSERQLQFYWGRVGNERISTTLPYNMFLFIIDSTKVVPTVEFIFSELFLNQMDAMGDKGKSADYNPNPNSWLNEKTGLQQAVVRISPKDLEKEIYLPK